jgi:hypothetical protein
MHGGLQILIFLAVVLGIITLLGHGIWVFLAFIFSGGRKKHKKRFCVFCGKTISINDKFCYWCMRGLTGPLAAEMTDIEAMLRQLDRLKRQGTLEPETAANLVERIKKYREGLLHPKSATAPVAVQETVVPAFVVSGPSAVEIPRTQQTPVVVEKPPAAVEKPHEKIALPIVQAAIDSARLQEAAVQSPKDVPVVTPPPSLPPPAPRKSWSDILGGFLAERNIRWTELIGVLLGGLLMVGSSIALVIAFWSQLESIPALKFLIFVGYSSAVFAAGLFVFYRWKLESTGRGLMVIATLLVPLNFLAMASYYKESWNALTGVMELISLGIFTWLTALAAKALTPERRWNTVLAVIGNSAAVLLAARPFFQHSPPGWFIAAGCVPSILLMATIIPRPRPLSQGERGEYDADAANSLFTFLGIAVFSTAAALGLIMAQGVKFHGLSFALYCLTTPLSLAALGVLAVGLQAARGMIADPELEGYRTAGTAVALLGVVLQLASIVMAWPQPLLIVAVGIVGAAGLAYLALRHDFPPAHAGAMVSLALAYLAGFYAIFDEGLRNLQSRALIIQSDTLSKDLLSLAISARSGTALAGLFILFAAISEWFLLRGKKEHGKMYVGGAAAAALVGLILVTAHGFVGSHADAVRATVLYAVYGIVCVFLSIRWRQMPFFSYLGWNLLAVAPMWLIRSPALDVWQSAAALAGCGFWLGLAWILLAWMHRKSGIFIAGQVVMIAAGILGTLSWLEWRQWIVDLPDDLINPGNIQVFGVGLGFLSLAWMAVRIASRLATGGNENQKAANASAGKWHDFPAPVGSWAKLMQTRPEIDKITTYFVAAVQFVLIGWMLGYGCMQEFSTSAKGISLVQISACGGCAWVLLGVLAILAVAALWDRWGLSELQLSLVLAISAPVLIADRFVNDFAAASAARWTMALCFVACSSAVWGRKSLEKLCEKLRARLEIPRQCPGTARGMLVMLSALPVLLLTLQAAVLQLDGRAPYGPLAGTFFDKIGPNISYLVPLVLVMVGLIGHGLRESSAGYVFGAGLVAEMAVILGYALHITLASPPRRYETAEFIVTVQLAIITAAVWAIIWLTARRWVNVWREGRIETPLMNVQIAMAVLGNALLIGMGILEVFLIRRLQPELAMHAGLPLGWIALLMTAGAGAYRRLQIRRHWDPHFVGLSGMGVLALLACTVPNIVLPDGIKLDGVWAYRVLMLGWAIYALLVALAAWWIAALRTPTGAQGPPQALIRLAAVWVRAAGIAAVILGIKAAVFHGDVDYERLWAAAAIAIASTAGATMAVWRRREGWAFTAALGVNLAASIAVWHFEQALNLSFDQWWVRLVQANVIASSLAALFWLAAHKRLYAHWGSSQFSRDGGLSRFSQSRGLSQFSRSENGTVPLTESNNENTTGSYVLSQSPLLAVQTVLPILANAAILVLPVFSLIAHPQGLPYRMRDLSDPPGWLGLLLCAAAAAWYLYQSRAASLLNVLGGAAIGAGVLFACSASGTYFCRQGGWQEYHLLFTAWAAAAFAILGAGFAGKELRLPAKDDPAHVLSISVRVFVFPKNLVKIWTTILGTLAVVMALLYCHDDPSGALWRLRALVGMSLAAGIIALWLRSAGHVFASGLLLCAAGTAACLAWRPGEINSLVYLNALSLAAGAIVWTLLEIIAPRHVLHFSWNNKPLRFSHLAAASGLAALGALAAVALTLDLLQLNNVGTAYSVVYGAVAPVSMSIAYAPLGWWAIAVTAAAIAMLLWDRAARLPLLGLYASALVAVAMQWDYWQESTRMTCLRAGSDLACFAIVAAIGGWLLPKARRICRWLLIPDYEGRWPGGWFLWSQAFVVCVAGALGVWLALDFGFDGLAKGAALFGLSGRLIGITDMLMVLGAAIVMAWQAKPARRVQWQYVSFIAGLFVLSSFRWAGIDPAQGSPWLHRSVVFLISAAMMTLLCSFGLRKVLPSINDWIAAARRMTPAFGVVAVLMLGLVLGQEWFSYRDKVSTPLVMWEIIAVAAIVAAMLATCLAFAVREDWDPMRLSPAGRQAYVYLAEVFAVLIGAHLRFTKPELFNFGLIKNYWMFLIMGAAFAGAGLSEWFHRRKLPVLSLPLQRTALLLPLAPAIGFWFLKDPQTPLALVGRTPDVWFLMAAFYGLLAYMRRSPLCGLLAALTANMGLWVALHQFDVAFLRHPQLWLIPIALAALVAEFIHHERLNAAQSAALRYLSLSVIYISSTADMFIDMFTHGICIDWRLPVALMLLSAAGALAGVVLRIRSFLILGISFLLLDIVTMIWYAAEDLEQTWIWYASGIVLGAAIIAVFAVFEKRRNNLLAALQRFKEWER